MVFYWPQISSTHLWTHCSSWQIVRTGCTKAALKYVFWNSSMISYAYWFFLSQTWLHSASTCPVCRKRVAGPSAPLRCPRHERNFSRGADINPGPSNIIHRQGGNDDDDEIDDEGFDEIFHVGPPPWRRYDWVWIWPNDCILYLVFCNGSNDYRIYAIESWIISWWRVKIVYYYELPRNNFAWSLPGRLKIRKDSHEQNDAKLCAFFACGQL